MRRESMGLPIAQDGMLVMTLHSEEDRPSPLTVALTAAGKTQSYILPLQGASESWRSYGIPLACFRIAGLDMSQVETMWEISSDQAFAFSLSRNERATAADELLPFPPVAP